MKTVALGIVGLAFISLTTSQAAFAQTAAAAKEEIRRGAYLVTGKHFGEGRPLLPPMPWFDAAVLTGDLPLDAYLDKGFDAWLKRSSH